MKLISRIAIVLLLVSCQAEEPQPTQQNCNCDRVVSHTKFNLPTGQSYGDVVTINDCSGEQINGTWNTQYGDTEPTNGECL